MLNTLILLRSDLIPAAADLSTRDIRLHHFTIPEGRGLNERTAEVVLFLDAGYTMVLKSRRLTAISERLPGACLPVPVMFPHDLLTSALSGTLDLDNGWVTVLDTVPGPSPVIQSPEHARETLRMCLRDLRKKGLPETASLGEQALDYLLGKP